MNPETSKSNSPTLCRNYNIEFGSGNCNKSDLLFKMFKNMHGCLNLDLG